MLTFWAPGTGSATGLSRRDFLAPGRPAWRGSTLADVLRLRAQARRPHPVAPGRHHGLPGGRPQPHRHVRPEARRPGRVSAASSSRSRPTCPASTSASTCRCRRRSPTSWPWSARVQFVEPMQHELRGGLHRLPQVGEAARRSAPSSAGSAAADPQAAVLRQPASTAPAPPVYESPQYLGAAHRPLHISGSAGVRNLEPAARA